MSRKTQYYSYQLIVVEKNKLSNLYSFYLLNADVVMIISFGKGNFFCNYKDSADILLFITYGNFSYFNVNRLSMHLPSIKTLLW